MHRSFFVMLFLSKLLSKHFKKLFWAVIFPLVTTTERPKNTCRPCLIYCEKTIFFLQVLSISWVFEGQGRMCSLCKQRQPVHHRYHFHLIFWSKREHALFVFYRSHNQLALEAATFWGDLKSYINPLSMEGHFLYTPNRILHSDSCLLRPYNM